MCGRGAVGSLQEMKVRSASLCLKKSNLALSPSNVTAAYAQNTATLFYSSNVLKKVLSAFCNPHPTPFSGTCHKMQKKLIDPLWSREREELFTRTEDYLLFASFFEPERAQETNGMHPPWFRVIG